MRAGRGCSAGLRGAAALAAFLLWSAPSAQAVPAAVAESVPVVATSASWGVVMSNAAQGPYPPGTSAAISGAIYADQYVTAANTGTRVPGTVSYLYSGNSLLINAFVCPTPWDRTTARCAGGQGTTVALNSPVSGAAVVPPVGGVLYLKLNFLVGGSGTLEALTTKPAVVTTNA